MQAFSKQTIPEIGRLVHNLRETSEALGALSERLNQGGASSLIGSRKLPDYQPHK